MNILKGTCDHDCSSTWRYAHGASVPGGPFPGTKADEGDVRRCEHGRIWLFAGVKEDGYWNKFDQWRPVSRWLQPRVYRRAERVLLTSS